MSGLKDLGEFGLIARLTKDLPRAAYDLLGMGDDCAVLRVGDRVLLVTSDATVEGVHFDRRWCSLENAGWRAMAGAVSDIAAMGGMPLGATVSLALPADMALNEIEGLYEGLRGAAARHGAAIIGGGHHSLTEWRVY
jgi:thiamine-monophosphate kinase